MTKQRKKLYRNSKWYEFSEKVKKRDSYKCQQCFRSSPDVVLQVHHEIYRKDKLIWEYALSDCITLCKGCHAKEHNYIERDYGWTLLGIDDLGARDAICERPTCNTPIRYEHFAYHPKYGYRSVGSTCIQFLTEEDKLKSRKFLKLYKKIGSILNKMELKEDRTKKNNKLFLFDKYRKSIIRIYNNRNTFSYQLAIYKSKNYFDWQNIIFLKDIQNIEFIKELALIHLLGELAKQDEELEEDYLVYRDLYQNIKRALK